MKLGLDSKAFVSYMRSVYLHKDKAIFQLDKLPADRFAAALGLPGTPKIKFLAREKAKQKKNASRDVDGADGKEDSGSESESEGGPSDKEEKDMDETANVKKVRSFNKHTFVIFVLTISCSLVCGRSTTACSNERTKTSFPSIIASS